MNKKSSKFPPEGRERAVRLVREQRDEYPSAGLHSNQLRRASVASTILYASESLHWTSQSDTQWTAAGHRLPGNGKAATLFAYDGGIQAYKSIRMDTYGSGK